MLIGVAALVVLIVVGAVAFLAGKTKPSAATNAGNVLQVLDRDSAALIQRGSVTLPANVQEAWLHPSHKYLYVAWSNGGGSYSAPDGLVRNGDSHGISAFRIDPASGALVLLGKPAPLPSRFSPFSAPPPAYAPNSSTSTPSSWTMTAVR